MITTKELQYVKSWANKIPMPGEEYAKSVLETIGDCVEHYKRNYLNKDYNIILSNGEEIDFEILEQNLCHMFGIDYKNIRGEYFNSAREEIFGTSEADFSSYQLIELILEHGDKIIKNDNDPTKAAKFINYYKSQIKCEIYNRISNFEKFNFGVIQDNYEGKSQKLLFVPSNEAVCPYFIMGIIHDDSFDDSYFKKYVVNTLLAPQDIKEFFMGKEVVIPTQILVSDNDNLKKYNATASEKIALLTMYKNIINTYQIDNKLNISGDYEAILNDISNQEEHKKMIRQ